MINLEQVMKAKLDGTFRVYNFKGEFSTRKVPKNFNPDHLPSGHARCGSGSPKTAPKPEMLEQAVSLLRTGIGKTRAKFVLCERLNISHESASIILKQAGKKIDDEQLA